MKRWRLVLAGVLLFALSAFVGWKVIGEDYGPWDGWINFHSTELIDRRSLGYNFLPEYHKPQGFPGYFDLYANDWEAHHGIGKCVYDEPFWPDGDPGLGAANPLPPLVRRHTIRAVSPEVPVAVLTIVWVGWICWLTLPMAWRLRGHSPGRGFDVIKAAASPTGALPRPVARQPAFNPARTEGE
jgi:hypothetical protein